MSLSSAVSRMLALALLLAVGALVYRVAVSPIWQSYLATRDAVAEREAHIARLLGIAARGESLSGQLEALRDQDASRAYLLPGSSATLAAAALQERIKLLLERRGGQLTSTQVLQLEPGQEGLDRVVVRVHLTLGTPALQRTLHEFESRPPLLIIDELTVIARGGRDVLARGDHPLDLDVQFRVSGWMRASAEGA